MKKTIEALAIFFLLITVYACENESIKAETIDKEKDFANIAVGKVWEYKYDSLNYLSGGANKISKKGFLRVEITESLENGKYRMIRSFKKDSLGIYIPMRSETVQLDESTLQTTDHNLTFINLVFPPKINTVWQGNRLMNDQVEITINDEIMKVYGGWEYSIIKRDTTLQLFNKSYPKTLIVNAGPKSDNLIARRNRKEFYTKGVGLTKVTMEVLNTQKILPATAWKDKAESGFIYTQELIRFR